MPEVGPEPPKPGEGAACYCTALLRRTPDTRSLELSQGLATRCWPQGLSLLVGLFFLEEPAPASGMVAESNLCATQNLAMSVTRRVALLRAEPGPSSLLLRA